MKRMKKGVVAVLLLTMLVSMFAACGSKEAGSAEATFTNDGTVFRIAIWNDEFQSRFNNYYDTDGNGMIGPNNDIKVEWVMTPSEGNAYQNKLDEQLPANVAATAANKIDLFCIEADYALKYVNSDYTIPITDIGVTTADMADQYKYTQEIVTDSNGKIKGSSWQATPGLFVYRRSIAKEIFGTDEPTEIQALLSDWDKFDAAAKKLHDDSNGGYQMLSGFDDSYRTFSNNVSAPWVNSDSKIVIDDQIWAWVDQTKAYTDNGYNQKTTLWAPEWTAGQTPSGTVFGYFYSTWGINFTLLENSLATQVKDGGKEEVGNGIYGDWAVCQGPQSYYWGGTWICAANGTDNADLVADVIKVLTCNKDTMKKITLDTQDYTNNKTAIQEIIDAGFGSPFLGGQDHLSLFQAAADKIDMSNTSPYDQGLNEKFQEEMREYFRGNVDKDTALANFYTAIAEIYPDLKK